MGSGIASVSRKRTFFKPQKPRDGLGHGVALEGWEIRCWSGPEVQKEKSLGSRIRCVGGVGIEYWGPFPAYPKWKHGCTAPAPPQPQNSSPQGLPLDIKVYLKRVVKVPLCFLELHDSQINPWDRCPWIKTLWNLSHQAHTPNQKLRFHALLATARRVHPSADPSPKKRLPPPQSPNISTGLG